jgi:hypothetical protein
LAEECHTITADIMADIMIGIIMVIHTTTTHTIIIIHTTIMAGTVILINASNGGWSNVWASLLSD